MGALLQRHHADRELRRVVMGAHLAEGLGAEHTSQVGLVVSALLERGGQPFGGRVPLPHRLRLFVATRAALGVARALADEVPAQELPEAALEEEEVRLVPGYLGAPAAPTGA